MISARHRSNAAPPSFIDLLASLTSQSVGFVRVQCMESQTGQPSPCSTVNIDVNDAAILVATTETLMERMTHSAITASEVRALGDIYLQDETVTT